MASAAAATQIASALHATWGIFARCAHECVCVCVCVCVFVAPFPLPLISSYTTDESLVNRFNVALYTGEMEFHMAAHLHKVQPEGTVVCVCVCVCVCVPVCLCLTQSASGGPYGHP